MKINFLTPDLWDACVDVTHRPQLPDSNRADYAGVDIGLKHDNAAIVVVSCTTSGVTLVSHRIRKPTSAQPLDLEQTIEAFLLDWHQR